MDANNHHIIRELFDEYLQLYAARDHEILAYFSEDFSGFTGGGSDLVKSREEWAAIIRRDFGQTKESIRLELKDLAIQELSDTVAVATGFFAIQLPMEDHILSRETARLVLVFHLEATGWKISHSSLSFPYRLVGEGEMFPLQDLVQRNEVLKRLVDERTSQLREANDNLQQTNEKLAYEIARHRQTEAVLQENEEIYRSVMNSSPDAIIITDLDGRILMVSPAATAMFGANTSDDDIGRLFKNYIIPDDLERAWANVSRRFKEESVGPKEYRGVRKDGTLFDIEVNSAFIHGIDGQPTKLLLIVRDITERKLAEQRIRQLVRQLEIEKDAAERHAITDSLTGLANRRYFDETIRTEFARLKRSGAPLSLVLFDVDYFKKFNDRYGHLAGDNCLRTVGKALKAVVGRVSDFVARYGGEEFVAILPETGREGAIKLAERVRLAVVELAIPHAGSEVADHITISLGVVTVTADDDLAQPEEAVALADTALYMAKDKGRNCSVYYENANQKGHDG